MCLMHYRRVLRNNHIELFSSERKKFIENIDITDENCINWPFKLTPSGYSYLSHHGITIGAYRYSYEYHKGSLIKGLVIDHLCRNRACVNPNHLDQVTNIVNVARGVGQSVINKLKTHCAAGHEYNEPNTRVDKANKRSCRACERNRKNRPM